MISIGSLDSSAIQILAVVGLGYDIVGALMLCRALMWSSPEELAKQQETRFCGNPDLLYELCKQTFDAKWGGIVLTLGFLMQAASSAGFSLPLVVIGTLFAVWVVIIIVYFLLRERFVRTAYMRAIDALSGDEKDRETMRELYPGSG
jgi:hypothetical protein